MKVSVIVPFYNVQDYIEKCLQSLKEQTLDDIEFILVDDGSPDSSIEIVRKYLGDSRFKLYTKKNGGLSDARNYGMSYATGEYIAFLDSDDYVEKTMYQELYEQAKATNADLIECDFIWEYPDKSRIDETQVKDNLLIDIRVVAWNKLYRRTLIEKTGIKFMCGVQYEDVNWCYKIIPYIENFSSVHKPFVHYIQRGNSISNTQNEKVRDIFAVLQDTIDYYKKHNLYNQYRIELEYLYIRYLLGSSFKRILGIQNKDTKNTILSENWNLLNSTFPNWKHNPILKAKKDMKNRYFKALNRTLYFIASKVIKRK
ncbi:glycosyltransferase [Breznakia sp. OttesenSCG-928-G09]|nr:glycosyltransferase [Breznakia sp. OttesenSCG-928-G09]